MEKPLFEKYKKFRIINNKVFVGYNMRFNPLISFIKKIVNKEKFWSINIICGSYLPMWRKILTTKNLRGKKKIWWRSIIRFKSRAGLYSMAIWQNKTGLCVYK